jgi:hypothetical protein
MQVAILGLGLVVCGLTLADEHDDGSSKSTISSQEDEMGGAVLPWTRTVGLAGTCRLLKEQAIREELELIDEQLEDVNELAENYNKRMAAVTRERLRRFPDDLIIRDRAASRRLDEWRKAEVNKFGPQCHRKMVLILLPHQNRRLSQIVCRGMGLELLLKKEVQEHLELTDEQKKQFNSILGGFYDAMPGNPGLPLPPDEKEANDDRMRRECLALMTAEQKRKLKADVLGE